MKTYIVTEGPVSVGPGVLLALSAEQAALREHNLDRAVGKDGEPDLYSPKAVIQFKTGEIFKMDGTAPKGVTEQLGDVARMKPAEVAAVHAKAKAGRSSTVQRGGRKASKA